MLVEAYTQTEPDHNSDAPKILLLSYRSVNAITEFIERPNLPRAQRML